MTLDVIGERWTIIIIRDLYFGRSRFNELLESSPGMSTKILSERLKLLEAHGLVERRIYSEHPLRAEYSLTPRGMSLEPVLNAIGEWGRPQSPEPGGRTCPAREDCVDATAEPHTARLAPTAQVFSLRTKFVLVNARRLPVSLPLPADAC